MLRRTWASVDAEAIKANFRAVRGVVGERCLIMPTVKADGYGHGAVPVAQAMVEAGADRLSISNLCEAVELREAGITLPLLILGYTPPCEAAELARLRITQTVADAAYAAQLSAQAVRDGVTVQVHIKLDTGMSRLGFVYHDEANAACIEEIAAACALPNLEVEGIFTHFAKADEDEAFTRRQFALFEGAVAQLAARGVRFAVRHCCNSAATLNYPEMHLDMVRPGLLIYGVLPDEQLPSLPLQPAMTLKTVVAQVKTVPAGTPVSYGGTAVTARESVLATVPIGYADGLPRAASNRGVMLVGGAVVPIIGRVCMDQCVLDVTGVAVNTGDEVTVFGAELPVERLAQASQTISYEILCRVGQRVPRAY